MRSRPIVAALADAGASIQRRHKSSNEQTEEILTQILRWIEKGNDEGWEFSLVKPETDELIILKTEPVNEMIHDKRH